MFCFVVVEGHLVGVSVQPYRVNLSTFWAKFTAVLELKDTIFIESIVSWLKTRILQEFRLSSSPFLWRTHEGVSQNPNWPQRVEIPTNPEIIRWSEIRRISESMKRDNEDACSRYAKNMISVRNFWIFKARFHFSPTYISYCARP